MDTIQRRVLSERLLGNVVVDEYGCFIWQGKLDRDGYGEIKAFGPKWRVHRLAFTIWRKDIPHGLCVCHHCDVPRCINPAHLFIGTNRENILDSVRKHRRASGQRHGSRTHPERLARGIRNGSKIHPENLTRGESNPNSKLTWGNIVEIRHLRSHGTSLVALARRFGVAHPTIRMIVLKRTWKPEFQP